MVESSLAVFCNGLHIGTVRVVIACPGFSRGSLHLDDCRQRPIFDSVAALAAAVDGAEPNDYQAAWYDWQKACMKLQQLNVSIGANTATVDQLTIESDWSIEWR